MITIFSILMYIGSCRTSKYGNYTKIDISPDTLYINKIAIGDSILAKVKIINVGDNDLEINNISAACECTIISFDTLAIKKKDSTFVKIKYVNKFDTTSILKYFIIEANVKQGLIPFVLATK